MNNRNVFKTNKAKLIMNKWIELLLGLILLLAPIILALSNASWGLATLQFIKGGLVIFVAVIGLMFIMLGISDMGN